MIAPIAAALKELKILDTGIFLETTLSDGAPLRLRVSCAGANVFRLQYADGKDTFPGGGVSQFLSAIPDAGIRNEELPVTAFPAGKPEKAESWEISSQAGTARLVVRRDPFRIELYNSSGSAVTRLDGIGGPQGGQAIGGDLIPGECLYGTGERFNGADQRGREVRIWAVDRWSQTEGNSYLPIPFLLSSRGYGILVNRYESCSMDLGAADADRWSVVLDGAPMDAYLFLDAAPADCLARLAALTGHAPLPAEWTFGVHVCRHARLGEFGTREGVMEMVRRMEEGKLPWSSVILEGWNAYDASRYGELASLLKDLHAMGKKALLYEACGRVPETLAASSPAADGCMVVGPDGSVELAESDSHNPADAPGRRKSRFLDVTNPEALRWWKEDVWGRLLGQLGVDGAKIDFCEQFPEWDGMKLADGQGPAGMHHRYPTGYNIMMYRLYRDKRPEGGMCFSRGGGTGAQLYPYVWCGDQLREWRFLRAVLSSLLSAGLSGVPFLCHDLAGYMPSGDPAANDEARVFLRGAELACFTVNMQTHGTVTRPYDFPKPVVDVYRHYSQIHYALVPYLMEQAQVSCTTGMPLTRHLYLEFPGDETARKVEDQYLLGHDILVAPVLDDVEERDIYLPAGSWHDLVTSEACGGARWLRGFKAPLERIPAFYRRDVESRELPEAIDTLYRIGQPPKA